MNSFNKFLFSPLVCLAFACGSTDNGDLFDGEASDGGDQFGSVEQAMSAPTSPTYQYGTRTSTTQQRCDRSAAGQVCNIPNTKSMKFCYFNENPSGFSNDDSADIESAVTMMRGAFGWGWTAATQDIFTGMCGATDANVRLFVRSVGSSGTASNDIKDYAKVNTFSSVTGLTEGAGVVGSYQKHSGCDIYIDRTDILAKGASTADDRRLMRHAVAHALLACVGIGGRSSVASNHSSRNDINTSVERNSMTAGEKCTLENFSTSSGTSFVNSGSCPSD